MTVFPLEEEDPFHSLFIVEEVKKPPTRRVRAELKPATNEPMTVFPAFKGDGGDSSDAIVILEEEDEEPSSVGAKMEESGNAMRKVTFARAISFARVFAVDFVVVFAVVEPELEEGHALHICIRDDLTGVNSTSPRRLRRR